MVGVPQVPPGPSLDGGGKPPGRSGWGVPPHHDWMGSPPTIASTCYAAGGMSLAFTQEDFLVDFNFVVDDFSSFFSVW